MLHSLHHIQYTGKTTFRALNAQTVVTITLTDCFRVSGQIWIQALLQIDGMYSFRWPEQIRTNFPKFLRVDIKAIKVAVDQGTMAVHKSIYDSLV